jgi:hypothetical protein
LVNDADRQPICLGDSLRRVRNPTSAQPEKLASVLTKPFSRTSRGPVAAGRAIYDHKVNLAGGHFVDGRFIGTSER